MLRETGEAIDARTRIVERAKREVGDQNPDRYYTLDPPTLPDATAVRT